MHGVACGKWTFITITLGAHTGARSSTIVLLPGHSSKLMSNGSAARSKKNLPKTLSLYFQLKKNKTFKLLFGANLAVVELNFKAQHDYLLEMNT